MQLTDFFSPEAVSLDLRATTKDEILAELVGLLELDERSSETLLRMLQRRETLGSTGVGRGIAIPHCRSLVVSHLRLAFGHKREGVDFQAIDAAPGIEFLSHRRSAHRGLESVPAGARQDRAVRQGRRCARRASPGWRRPEEFFDLLREKGV